MRNNFTIIDLQWLASHKANDSNQDGGSGQLNRFEAGTRSGIISTCLSPVVQILSDGGPIGVL
jgi:hypothetical protein